jgi:lysophospholipase L1-like esterase
VPVGETPSAVREPVVRLLMNRRVLWLGDSITHDGKYVSFIEYCLQRRFPDVTFDFIAIGLGSETVSGLSENSHPFPRPCVFTRLQAALDAVKPATVVACYGMNDGIYHPQSQERTRAFQDGIHRLSAAVHASEAQFILLTPTPFEPGLVKNPQPATAPDFGYSRPFTNYDRVLREYGRWELSLPVGEARLVIDLHTPLDEYLARRHQQDPGAMLTTDGVHPKPLGHLLMAQAVLRAMGADFGASDPEAELARLEADPLFKLVRERREHRSNGWRDFVGYTRETTVKSSSVGATEVSAAELQVKIDALRRAGVEPAR